MGWGWVDWVFTLGTASAATFANSLIAAAAVSKMAKWRDYAVFLVDEGGPGMGTEAKRGEGKEEKAVQKRENTSGVVVGPKSLNVR
jgi:hypothetical protein